MKNIAVFKWLSVMIVVLIVAAAIGCGKKESQEPTPTPVVTASPTATIPAEPTGETGTLSGQEGDVQVLRQGASAWVAATSGIKIGTGDSLKTGSDGYVLITFFDGSVMEVEADTEITVDELSKGSGGATTVSIYQVIGHTINRVDNLVDSSSTYEVETPAGSAVVRGTWLDMLVDWLGLVPRTCCGTLNQGDGQEHSSDFSNNGKTVGVPVNWTSCAMGDSVPSDPFPSSEADDPLQGSSMTNDGGGSSCPDECWSQGYCICQCCCTGRCCKWYPDEGGSCCCQKECQSKYDCDYDMICYDGCCVLE